MLKDPSVELENWLKSKKPDVEAIPLEADLVNEGFLDSLQFVNFLMFIEKIRDEAIPEDQIMPMNFTSLQTILNNFFPLFQKVKA